MKCPHCNKKIDMEMETRKVAEEVVRIMDAIRMEIMPPVEVEGLDPQNK